ncbi:MAG: tyrosine-type recombinase/integrase [Actinomycetota bacterium]|nr:tyrosine-type recombinase/integrase [Actinomycetota bacterium]
MQIAAPQGRAALAYGVAEEVTMSRTYPDPWVPRSFSTWIKKGSTVERASAGGGRRTVDCWDVAGRVDGMQWRKRFRRAGHARTWKERLERDFAAGLPFDLRTKQFVAPSPPPAPMGPTVPTVFELTEAYFHQHPEWEPRTKVAAAASLNRARRWLLIPDASPDPATKVAVDDFLDHASFLPGHLADQMTDRQREGRAWLEAHSAPADSLTAAQVEAFVARFEINQRNPAKRVSAATITRFLQSLKACWTWAVSRDEIPIDRNPWVVIRPRRKVKGKATAGSTREALAVDADLVLDVPQSLELAKLCSTEGTWGPVVECFVLVMALSGLRPGEAAGLLWEDVDLPADDGPGWLTVRRSHRPTAARWLDTDEDPDWGPLKDRDLTDTRRAPMPPVLTTKLRHHLSAYGEGPSGLVFHRNGKPFDHDLFGRNVWTPARRTMFPPRQDLAADDPRQPKLSRLRRHDLRHAACSWWLREGVDAVVCQRWSGHKTLSVFLDIYQGVAPGREDDGVRRLVVSFG